MAKKPAVFNPSSRRISSAQVPEGPPGSYSQCKRVGNHVYMSGQIAIDRNGKLVSKSDPYLQARQIFRNIKALMEAAGGTVNDVVKITMYTLDIRFQPEIWKARREVFSGDFPASTLVGVTALFSPDNLVEVEAIGYIDDKPQRKRR
ncbi:MAG: RidA family protein [Alphaproteobacteria bacterium]|nr:RidA family protein [Alphaproteobacteria bacterium]